MASLLPVAAAATSVGPIALPAPAAVAPPAGAAAAAGPAVTTKGHLSWWVLGLGVVGTLAVSGTRFGPLVGLILIAALVYQAGQITSGVKL